MTRRPDHTPFMTTCKFGRLSISIEPAETHPMCEYELVSNDIRIPLPDDFTLDWIDEAGKLAFEPTSVQMVKWTGTPGAVNQVFHIVKKDIKQEMARSICKLYGFENYKVLYDWVIIEQVIRLFKSCTHGCNTSCPKTDGYCVLWRRRLYTSDIECRVCPNKCCDKQTHLKLLDIRILFAESGDLFIAGYKLSKSDFTVDRFKRLVHQEYPILFPEVDYELDGPEWKKAVDEMTVK